eukprot:CAMPEP_0168385530 /NCGR_PEP_ID=MMETSP0228-20121227/14967_1 /TAXON_ID=133427 /ORGANISM="Protoceratium reticulatum, Strain CCCM 535 (=CCMP 1889)" /LENGTH=68 /DNA_ID=CAMNT_0008398717 /DNA_START=52 /DNA_END=254 /DNA_ORIENTATION=+
MRSFDFAFCAEAAGATGRAPLWPLPGARPPGPSLPLPALAGRGSAGAGAAPLTLGGRPRARIRQPDPA